MEQWKEYKYTEIASLIGGGTPKTSEVSYWGGDIPWLSVKNLGWLMHAIKAVFRPINSVIPPFCRKFAQQSI